MVEHLPGLNQQIESNYSKYINENFPKKNFLKIGVLNFYKESNSTFTVNWMKLF